MVQVKDQVKGFVASAFLLLGALFGMIIMTFIFAQLGPAQSGLTLADQGFNESLTIQNNSLQAIVKYTEQADTQFTTVGITITLLILIALFLVFWNIFIKDKKKGGGSSFG